jgi:hypothetical protein
MFGSNLNQQQQQQPQQGGLFGGTSTGGLFGQPQGMGQMNQPQQGGLWGSQNTLGAGKNLGSNPGGFFGQSTSLGGMGMSSLGGNTSNPAQGGLFGQPQQQGSTGGGLLGQGSTGTGGTLVGGSGIFGQQQPSTGPMSSAPTTGGLFGSTPSSGSGLFGNQQQQQQPQTGGFGGFGQSTFGSTGQQQGSGLFGQTQPQQGSGLFGGMGNGLVQPQQQQQGTSGLFGGMSGGLGQTTQPQQQGGLFSSTSTTFGQPQQPQQIGTFSGIGLGGIGQNQQQPQQQGLGSSLFGQQPNTMSATTQQTGMFGTSVFGGGSTNIGQSGGLLGSSTTKPGGLFGTTTGAGLGVGTSGTTGTGFIGMGQQQQIQQPQMQQQSNVTSGTYPFTYQPTQTQEQSNVNGQQKLDKINLISITAMEYYCKKSIEELRYEDFKNKKSGLQPPKPQQGGFGVGMGMGGGFGTGVSSGLGGIGQTTGSGLFGSSATIGATSSTFSGGQLGQQQKPQTSSLFAPSGGITSSGFGVQQPQQPQQTGGLFGSTSTSTTTPGFGMTAQPTSTTGTTGGLFGATTTSTGLGGTSGLFGASSTINKPQTSTGGLFGQPQQQQSQPSGVLFGSTQQPQTTSTGGGLFSSTGIQQQVGCGLGPSIQAQPQGGLFGQQPTQTAGAGGLFGGSVISPQKTGGLFGQTATQPTLGAQPTTGGLFGSSTQQNITAQPSTTGLFGSSSTTVQPTTGSLFGAKPATSGGLFGPSTSIAPTSTGSSLFGATPSQGLTTNIGQKSSDFFPSSINAVPTTQQGTPLFPVQATDYKNFLISALEKKKTISDMLNDLQREYLEQEFLYDEYKRREKAKEINLSESKYSYVPVLSEAERLYMERLEKERPDAFLKSKRTYNKPKHYDSNVYNFTGTTPSYYTKELSREKPFGASKLIQEAAILKPKDLLDIVPEKSNKLNLSENDEKVLKKSHSCDLIKKTEKMIVNNLEKSFDEKVNLETLENGGASKSGISAIKKPSEKTLLDLPITLQDPIKVTFSVRINKNLKLNVLKSDIVEKLKARNYKMFSKINSNSFVLMKKYSILKDSQTLSELGIKDGEHIHILLKENFSLNNESNNLINLYSKEKAQNEYNESPSRKESRINNEKKKKKNKSELAPLDKIPVLTKPGYKTIPDYRNICRMTLDEIEHVKNFSIYNEYGRIDFEGETNLTNLNLDQIVNISKNSITVYQNEDLEFKPPAGEGLNKPAVLHLNECFPKGKEEDDQIKFLATLQKLCKDKGVRK